MGIIGNSLDEIDNAFKEKHLYGTIPILNVETSVTENMNKVSKERMEGIFDHMNKLFKKRLKPLETIMAARGILSRINQEVASAVVCRKGCDHCCRQAVTVTSTEAEIISRRYKQAMVKVTELLDQKKQIAKYYGSACPFLADSKCSIYDERPISCRANWNVSSYPELCDTVSNPGSSVPNLNTNKLTDLVVNSFIVNKSKGGLGKEIFVADIRDWFPVIVKE